MFVRTQGYLATVIGLAAATACSDGTNQPSDLRDGPPDVLAVVVNAYDSRDGFAGSSLENATFCRQNDDKRPEIVGLTDVTTMQVCPADLSMGAAEVTTALPGQAANAQLPTGGLITPTNGWYARIMFANLLDPNIEDLIPNLDSNMQPDGTFTGTLATTQPVTLTCGGVAVQYDGYYNPSGNALTYPVGPSLFIAPLDPTAVAGATECEITIKSSVKNKKGIAVPSNELAGYKFKVGQIQLLSAAPDCFSSTMALAGCMGDLTMPQMIDASAMGAATIVLNFDGVVDPASLLPTDVVLQQGSDCMTPIGVPTVAGIAPDGASTTALDIFDANAPGGQTFVLGTFYIFTFKANVTTVKDIAGGPAQPMPGAADFTVCVQT